MAMVGMGIGLFQFAPSGFAPSWVVPAARWNGSATSPDEFIRGMDPLILSVLATGGTPPRGAAFAGEDTYVEGAARKRSASTARAILLADGTASPATLDIERLRAIGGRIGFKGDDWPHFLAFIEERSGQYEIGRVMKLASSLGVADHPYNVANALVTFIEERNRSADSTSERLLLNSVFNGSKVMEVLADGLPAAQNRLWGHLIRGDFNRPLDIEHATITDIALGTGYEGPNELRSFVDFAARIHEPLFIGRIISMGIALGLDPNQHANRFAAAISTCLQPGGGQPMRLTFGGVSDGCILAFTHAIPSAQEKMRDYEPPAGGLRRIMHEHEIDDVMSPKLWDLASERVFVKAVRNVFIYLGYGLPRDSVGNKIEAALYLTKAFALSETTASDVYLANEAAAILRTMDDSSRVEFFERLKGLAEAASIGQNDILEEALIAMATELTDRLR